MTEMTITQALLKLHSLIPKPASAVWMRDEDGDCWSLAGALEEFEGINDIYDLTVTETGIYRPPLYPGQLWECEDPVFERCC